MTKIKNTTTEETMSFILTGKIDALVSQKLNSQKQNSQIKANYIRLCNKPKMTSSVFIITVYCSMDPGDDTLHYTSLNNVTPPKSSYSTQNYILIWRVTCGVTVANCPLCLPRPSGPWPLEFDSFIHQL